MFLFGTDVHLIWQNALPWLPLLPHRKLHRPRMFQVWWEELILLLPKTLPKFLSLPLSFCRMNLVKSKIVNSWGMKISQVNDWEKRSIELEAIKKGRAQIPIKLASTVRVHYWIGINGVDWMMCNEKRKVNWTISGWCLSAFFISRNLTNHKSKKRVCHWVKIIFIFFRERVPPTSSHASHTIGSTWHQVFHGSPPKNTPQFFLFIVLLALFFFCRMNEPNHNHPLQLRGEVFQPERFCIC